VDAWLVLVLLLLLLAPRIVVLLVLRGVLRCVRTAKAWLVSPELHDVGISLVAVNWVVNAVCWGRDAAVAAAHTLHHGIVAARCSR